jgi:Cu(I)/Ag(I) efflux system membrane fusion protein
MTKSNASDQDRSLTNAPEPARPRVAPRLIAAAVLGALAGAVGVYAAVRRPRPVAERAAAQVDHPSTSEKGALYRCPMHPAMTSDQPGACPICGMALVLDPQRSDGDGEAGRGPDAAGKPRDGVGAGRPRRVVRYRSPMNPKELSAVPRKDEMGMDFLPVYEDELTPTREGGSPAGDGAAVEGLAAVTIDSTRQQMIGLRTTRAARASLNASWRTVGRVEVDPTRVRRVNVKIEGYVERVFVDFVGKPVRKGQPLFSMYSPSLLAAQEEYLLALKTRRQLDQVADVPGGPGSGAGAAGEDLVSASRRKLELWDVPSEAIERLARAGVPTKTLTFVSPLSGVVTAKNIVEGATLRPGDAPYEITDLSMVWVMADAYDSDLARVRVGMTATLTLPSYPNRPFTGRVQFIDPLVDPKSRTTKVHVHVANPTGVLKPEMFGEVVLQGKPRMAIRIPADSVIRSGARDVVFLALGKGRFAPREIHLGARDGDFVEVLSGLAEGEEVVTRANFLVDSESRLRASLAALGAR